MDSAKCACVQAQAEADAFRGKTLPLHAEDERTEQSPTYAAKPHLPLMRSRHVHFDRECIVYDITPYAEIYGIHPREFDFEKGYAMAPAMEWGSSLLNASQVCEDECVESDEDDFESEEWEMEYSIHTAA